MDIKTFDDSTAIIKLTYNNEYYQSEPGHAELLELFFGIDFLIAKKEIEQDSLIITIESTKGKALTFADRVKGLPSFESDRSAEDQLGIYYLNNN